MRSIKTYYTPRKFNNRGDTIIEVLIAMAIVSLILTSSYALTNRNVQATQKIQEQSQAQKLVEQQIELMRTNQTFVASEINGGCLTSPHGDVASVDPFNPGPPAACSVGAASSGATYVLKVLCVDEPDGKCAVTATWLAVGGEQSQITMHYRR